MLAFVKLRRPRLTGESLVDEVTRLKRIVSQFRAHRFIPVKEHLVKHRLQLVLVVAMSFLQTGCESQTTNEYVTAKASGDDRDRRVKTPDDSGFFIESAKSTDEAQLCYVNDGLIYTAALDGSRIRRFVEGEAPRWSPSGDQIVYEEVRGGFSVLNPKTGQKRNVCPNGTAPRWSPGGDYFSFLEDDSIHCIDSDGGHLRKLGPLASGMVYTKLAEPEWSQNREYLRLAETELGNELRAINIDEESHVVLWKTIDSRIYACSFSLSPDRQHLAIVGFLIGSDRDMNIVALTIVDWASGVMIKPIENVFKGNVPLHRFPIGTAVWAPNSDMLAVAVMDAESRSGTVADHVLVCRSPDWESEIVFNGFNSTATPVPFQVTGLAWSSTSEHLVVAATEPGINTEKRQWIYFGRENLRPAPHIPPKLLNADRLFLVSIGGKHSKSWQGATRLPRDIGSGHAPDVRGGRSWRREDPTKGVIVPFAKK